MAGTLEIAWRWSQLLVALVAVIVEWVCREAITLVFRVVPLPWCSSGESKQSVDPNLDRDTLGYIEANGYSTEEHFVTTPDGYILGLHRILPRSPIFDGADESTSGNQCFPPVLIMHGFMQSSEAFAIRSNPNDSLPLVLANAGYDVWLGNNRGNKYSYKHVSKKPTQDDFWDFSLDDLARYDMPSMINHILARTGAKSLTLIGFSQGTAQSFAYLSNSGESSKVNLFVALAPVSIPRGFANPVVDSLARARPDFIFLLFGKKQLLPSVLFWRTSIPRAIYVKLIDFSLSFLFGWNKECLAESEKPLLYSHIQSHTSVKTVVHWFQIIQTGKFQMFDDSMKSSFSGPECYTGYALPQYPMKRIQTPIACFCGGRDTLPQSNSLLASLPKDNKVFVHIEERYEHLDFMWAKDVSQKIYPKVLALLKKYNSDDDSCEL